MEKLLETDEGEVYKPIGKTPKEILEFYLKECKKTKGAFYGRLDPMAHGIMKIYFDEKCKLASNQTHNKIYRFIMVSGFSSTSEDLLGYPRYEKPSKIDFCKLVEVLEKLKLEEKQLIPIHSSFAVANKHGEKKCLWEWAKERRIHEIERPLLNRKLLSYDKIKYERMTINELINNAIERINLIDRKHSFEQDEIIHEYEKLKEYLTLDEKLEKFTITATVENGYYIRQLVKRISEELEIPLITYEIERIAYLD